MANHSNNYDLLIEKLDQFTRKYYLNKLIRGLLYFTAVSIGLFVLFNLLEHQFYFSQGVRKIFFFSFLGASFAGLVWWVFAPLIKYLKLGKTISHEKAAEVIGSHFTDVQDKLLNILQLKKQADSNPIQASLISASINQKSEEIKPVAFKKAIDLSKNKKYLRYAAPPFLLLIALLVGAPSIIKDSTHRIINNDKKFEKAALFSLELPKDKLEVVQFEDYVLDVYTDGQVLPDEVFIQFEDFQYKLQKEEINRFSYTFKNVQKNTPFTIYSGDVATAENTLEVIKKPNLADFAIDLRYPSYIGRENETVNNVGDLVVPAGTRLRWYFTSENTDDMFLYFNNGVAKETKRKGDDKFSYAATFTKDATYKVLVSNKRIPKGDSLNYAIDVIPDEHPTIAVESFVDSTDSKLVFFVGNASDDYGLTAVDFKYRISNEDGQDGPEQSKRLLGPSGRATQYQHTIDFTEYDLKPGQNVSYYFETYDNDAINGSKSAKTGVMKFAKPSVEEFEEKEDENEEDIKKTLEESIDDIKKLQEEYKKLREKLLQQKDMSWQDKKELENLMEKQKDLQEKLQEAQEKLQENMKNQEEFNKQDEEILKKQEKLQEMFEEVLDPETQELMEKINELMEELNKDDAMEMMEEMEMDDQAVEKEMDRLLDLFKQLEMEKEIKDTIEKLEELAEKQEELAKETEEQKKPNEELKKEQEKINEEFEDVKEKMEELQEKNKELSPPKDMGDEEENEEQMEDIQEDMEESEEQLEQKDSKGASKSQKSAAGKMKKMAGGLQESMESGEQEQLEEDMAALRQLLENLVDLSFSEEELTEDTKVVKTTSPIYKDLVQKQFKLKDDFGLIQDSLHALSKRVDQLQAIVTEKTFEISSDIDSSLVLLEERKMTNFRELASIRYQRRIMTNTNDLALMLNEALNQMQQQMSGMMSGSQMCNKPGGKPGSKPGKVPSDKITEGQENLNGQMKKMKEGMKGKDGKGMAKEFAEAAARQAALRKALQDLNQEKQEQGKGSKELQQIIDEMNKVETDLVNKKFNNEVLNRQQDILTRLLESDKAERQREYDNKRKGETGRERKKEMPASIQAYLKEKEAEIELYKSISPELRPFYKGLVDKYYNALKAGN
jgi:hypothetical protein